MGAVTLKVGSGKALQASLCPHLASVPIDLDIFPPSPWVTGDSLHLNHYQMWNRLRAG